SERPSHKAHVEQARTDRRRRSLGAHHRAPHASPGGAPRADLGAAFRSIRGRRGRRMTTTGHADRDALMGAPAVVPGIYSRNRMFAMYGDPDVRRAKARAAVLRGVVRQLAGSHGEAEGVALLHHEGIRVLRYRIARVHLDRRLELSEIEAA